jgi:hypothetical protein
MDVSEADGNNVYGRLTEVWLRFRRTSSWWQYHVWIIEVKELLEEIQCVLIDVQPKRQELSLSSEVRNIVYVLRLNGH